eukprot:GHVT01016870.1.p1 GENE.GHVT01016870.1~~GHVT01016870.1.p1  ORF type:complete len:408 (-),score=89.04 GHVT01016870.1:750-1973(-)
MVDMPRLDDNKPHIILQAFNWQSCDNPDGWWNVLRAKLPQMAATGVSMMWLPPPQESVSPQGYMPTRWYSLASAYGSEEELDALNGGAHKCGIAPMLDLVVNHRCGVRQDSSGHWTIFEAPDWEGWAIVANNLQGYASASGAADTGEMSECAPDIDHTNPRIRKDVKAWIEWLFNEKKFKALRIDMAPGYSPNFQRSYVEHASAPFGVGEYWNGDFRVLHNYTAAAGGTLAAYDFAFYYVLRRCVESGNFAEMNRDGGKLNGLVGQDPQRAVTFLENHDTEHLEFVGKFAGGNLDSVLRGYAILLTHPGTPVIYWNHFGGYGSYCAERLQALGSLRGAARLSSTSGLHLERAEDGLYAAYVAPGGERRCHSGGGVVALKVGWKDWQPKGNGWKVHTTGQQFCVWARC